MNDVFRFYSFLLYLTQIICLPFLFVYSLVKNKFVQPHLAFMLSIRKLKKKKTMGYFFVRRCKLKVKT